MFTKERRESEARELAARLFRENRSRLLWIARRNTIDTALAEEALQEAFCAFIRAYDPQGEAPPLPWLILTLKRECWHRAQRSWREYRWREADHDPLARYEEAEAILESVPAPGPVADELMVRHETMRRRLSPLKADQRTALSLQAAGYSYEEIAELCDWTYTKVSRCLREGRAALAVA
jgi:RNA polymerase sigma factor (sigma-70 family)